MSDEKTQSMATAVIAVNAIANIPGLRPAESMLERATAPSDEEFEEDPEGVMSLWGGICERAYAAYRSRGPKKVTRGSEGATAVEYALLLVVVAAVVLVSVSLLGDSLVGVFSGVADAFPSGPGGCSQEVPADMNPNC